MADIFSQLIGLLGGAGRGTDFIGPRQEGLGELQGPELPIGGRAFNNAAAPFVTPEAISALGFLGGGLSGAGQAQTAPAVNPDILKALAQSQGVQRSQLSGTSALSPIPVGGGSNLGILQLLASLGR